jgi:carnitine 3-dehydrogenase
VRQSDAQAGGREIDELVRIRDDCLVSVLLGLKAERFGAGEEIAWTERRLLDRTAAQPMPDDEHGRLTLHEAVVVPEWIDYNGHMTEFRYLEVLGDATDALLRLIGVDAAYVATKGSYFTAETHIRYLAEARAGDRIEVATQLLGHDDKRVHVFHEVRKREDATAVATGEHMLLHFGHAAERVEPAPPEVLAALERIADRQRGLQRPPAAGRRIGGEPLAAA